MKWPPLVGEFEGVFYDGICEGKTIPDDGIMYDLYKPVIENQRVQPYPAGFSPTFHRYRLTGPLMMNKPSRIFVCSMADLFGEWVPASWIEEVFKACEAAPQHTYLFLTKNYLKASKYKYRDNWWIGKTITNNDNSRLFEGDPWSVDRIDRANQFLSIEPIQGDISDLKYYLYSFRWVIIGAETGQNKSKIIPKREWIEDIVNQCKAAGVPVFLKNSLKALMGDNFIQEWPEEMNTFNK